MAHRRRIDALKSLAIGALPAADAGVVNAEFERVTQAGKVRMQQRRYLLEVIHSSRATDTGLQRYLLHRESVLRRNIGGVLTYLKDNGIGGNCLSVHRYNTHTKNVAKVRNTYAHEAGAFPTNSTEVETLLDAMDACLTDVFSL